MKSIIDIEEMIELLKNDITQYESLHKSCATDKKLYNAGEFEKGIQVSKGQIRILEWVIGIETF